jgi:hypothetical protein
LREEVPTPPEAVLNLLYGQTVLEAGIDVGHELLEEPILVLMIMRVIHNDLQCGPRTASE